jgi:hypothetical protein
MANFYPALFVNFNLLKFKIKQINPDLENIDVSETETLNPENS